MKSKIDTLECFTTMDIWYDDYSVDVEYCYDNERRFEINNKEVSINSI